MFSYSSSLLLSLPNALLPCVGGFDDPDVTHVEGEVDPVRDLSIISEELRLKDEEKLMINLDKLEKLVTRGGDKKSKPEYVSYRARCRCAAGTN